MYILIRCQNSTNLYKLLRWRWFSSNFRYSHRCMIYGICFGMSQVGNYPSKFAMLSRVFRVDNAHHFQTADINKWHTRMNCWWWRHELIINVWYHATSARRGGSGKISISKRITSFIKLILCSAMKNERKKNFSHMRSQALDLDFIFTWYTLNWLQNICVDENCFCLEIEYKLKSICLFANWLVVNVNVRIEHAFGVFHPFFYWNE